MGNIDKYKDPKNTGGVIGVLQKENAKNKILREGITKSKTSHLIPTTAISANNKSKPKECTNFCRESGFSILPLIYSARQYVKHSLPVNLGKNVSDTIKLKKSKYTVSMINNGFIYLYFKRKGKVEWKGYITKKRL